MIGHLYRLYTKVCLSLGVSLCCAHWLVAQRGRSFQVPIICLQKDVVSIIEAPLEFSAVQGVLVSANGWINLQAGLSLTHTLNIFLKLALDVTL